MPQPTNQMSHDLGQEWWRQHFATAAMETTYWIGTKVYPRLPHPASCFSGGEMDCCPDCGAEVGELHIPGCDLERCPKCGGQAISCWCDVEEGRFRRTKNFLHYGGFDGPTED